MDAREERLLRPLRGAGPGYLLMLGGLAVLVLWALSVYRQQLATGLAVTGMNSPTTWGLYIVNFVFFVGLSAGGVIIASLVHAFGAKRFHSVARIAELMAISCLVLATMFIMLDLGRPERFYHLLLYGRLGSPLMWDVIVIAIYMVLGLAYGYFGARADLLKCLVAFPRRRWVYKLLALGYLDGSARAVARDRRILKVLAAVALPLAVALHSVTAWILGLLKAQPGWHSALLAPLFVVSATVSGLALLAVSVVFARRFLKVEVEEGVVLDLGRLLAFLIPVLGYFLFAELITVTYAKEPSSLQVFREMVAGRYAPLFWGNIVVGLVVPWVLVVRPRPRVVAWAGLPAGAAAIVGALWLKLDIPLVMNWVLPVTVGISVPLWMEYFLLWLVVILFPLYMLLSERWPADLRVGIAAAFVVLGVLAERWNIVVPSLMRHAHLPYAPGSYAPTGPEIILTLGVYAVGALIFMVCAKLFPLVETEEVPA